MCPIIWDNAVSEIHITVVSREGHLFDRGAYLGKNILDRPREEQYWCSESCCRRCPGGCVVLGVEQSLIYWPPPPALSEVSVILALVLCHGLACFSSIILDRHWQRATSVPLAFLFLFPVITVLTVLKEAFQVVCGPYTLSVAACLWRIQSALDFSKNLLAYIGSWWCYWQDAEMLVGLVVTLKLINLSALGVRLVFCWVLPLVLAYWSFLFFPLS